METGKETARRALGGDRGRGQGGARGQGWEQWTTSKYSPGICPPE